MTFLKREIATFFCLFFTFATLKSVLKLTPITGESLSVFRDDYVEQLKDFKTQILLTLFCSLQVNFKNEISSLREEISKKVKINEVFDAQVDTYNSLVYGLFKDYLVDSDEFEMSLETNIDGIFHLTPDVDIDYAKLFARHVVDTNANVQTIYLLLSYLNYVDSLLNESRMSEDFCFKNITPYIFDLFLVLRDSAFSATNCSYFTTCSDVNFTYFEILLLEKVKQKEEMCIPTQVFMIYERMLLEINKKLLAQLVEYFKKYPTMQDCFDNCKKSHFKQILNFDTPLLNWGVGTFQNYLEIKLKEDLMHVLLHSFLQVRFDILNGVHSGFVDFAKNTTFDVIYKWIKRYSVEPCNEVLLAEKYDMASSIDTI